MSDRPWRDLVGRPRHLLMRAVLDRRVFYVEPFVGSAGAPSMAVDRPRPGLFVCTPAIPTAVVFGGAPRLLGLLVDEMLHDYQVDDYVLWLEQASTTAVLPFLHPSVVVAYAAPHGADDPSDRPRPAAQLDAADVVFADDKRAYDAARRHHPNVHLVAAGRERRGRARRCAVETSGVTRGKRVSERRTRAGEGPGDHASWNEAWDAMWQRVRAAAEGARPSAREAGTTRL